MFIQVNRNQTILYDSKNITNLVVEKTNTKENQLVIKKRKKKSLRMNTVYLNKLKHHDQTLNIEQILHAAPAPALSTIQPAPFSEPL